MCMRPLETLHFNTGLILEKTHFWFSTFPTGPADYEGGTKIAIFEVGSSTATVTFGTEDDEVKEGMESFRATLSVSEAMREKGVSVGSPDTAVVNIIDNDGKRCCNYECMYSATHAGLRMYMYKGDWMYIYNHIISNINDISVHTV